MLNNIQSILVPVDFSKASFDAVRTALEMVDSPEKVSLIHAVEEPQSETDFHFRYVSFNLNPEDGAKDVIRELKEELEEKTQEFGFQGVKLFVEEGRPSETIASFSSEHNFDLIVVPSHSRSGLSRLFLGSVAGRVLELAKCPVLVLKRVDEEA